MSQVIFSSIDTADSGTDLATILNDFKDAIVSGLSGTSRPTNIEAGGGWIDTTNAGTPNFYWMYKIYTGSADVEVFRVHLDTGLSSVALAVEQFSIKKVSADTNGPILQLVKQRVATNGQVLDGDTVGTIELVGRTDTSTNPVVAYMTFVASDNMTTSAYGGELAFYSTPDATATATKHLRFVSGLVETVVPAKVNSLRMVGQNVATTATIAQVSAAQVLVEMTGSTATSIEGIDSAGNSQVVTVHNRSSANVTLKHQDAGATAVDRLKLPSSADFVLIPDATATLYYCTTDARWKMQSSSDKNFNGYTVDTYYGGYNSWTAPSGVTTVKARSYKRMVGLRNEWVGLLDQYGTAYAWGANANGQLGLGDVAARSSPVAVLGGLSFTRIYGTKATSAGDVSNFGISTTGSVYSWGGNTNGQLGLGDVTPRSSPVAVLGGLKFAGVFPRETAAYALTTGGAAYAWGINSTGNLGLGDVTPRSSPVAVLGGLRMASMEVIGYASPSVVCLTLAGAAYAWGANTNGNLGVGDVTPRSSPVAVLGGLTFSQIEGGCVTNDRYFFSALNSAGAAYSWGHNVSGQLGVGDTTPRSSPVAVLGGLTFKQLVSHPKSESMFGLTSTGVLYGWGANDQGQLGVGDTTNRSSPVAVLGGLTFNRVRMYRKIVFGVTSDGTVYAWGSNTAGVLGLGDVTSRSSPVAVLGGLKFDDMIFGDSTLDPDAVFGVQSTGTAYAWGTNSSGSLGLGDVTSRSSPVAVLGGLAADVSEPSTISMLTVVPATAYTISINAGIASFGSAPLGQGVYKVEVEYLL